jgi:hypothetical protein
MTLQVVDSAAPLVIDAAANATDASKSLTAPFDLKTYIPIFSFLGAAVGSIIVAFAQAWIARFNADRSDRSRLAVRKEEVISEGVLELIKLDPHDRRDGEKNQSALRSANSIKLFLSEESAVDKKLEEAVDEFVYCYSCVVDPNVDEELIERIQVLKDPDIDANSLSMERLEELLERLDDARSQILSAARSSIANERSSLRRPSP